ncbi:hypothetical protein EXU48_15940 [Occultella glacieicola]|uniref:Peptide ABC transporter permease n=1 Tax=Occultella glacieicola TaxID=2518684 RepID=A0ABY2E294_9MICO|nr:hypothetical protein [Occultella glacieicola]TDE91632.1 hypothetical protein EXU48_15940 [Occultella glacieicola]
MTTPATTSRDQGGAVPERSLLDESLSLFRTTGRLLRRHWLPLAVIATAGVAAHWYLLDLSVWLGRFGAVPGMLGLSLVPFSTMLAVIGMLLVLRRRERSRHVIIDIMAATGSVLVPFLVVYQSGGQLQDDLRHHTYFGLQDDFSRFDLADVDGTARIPDSTSTLVLGIVAVALVGRLIGGYFVTSARYWRGREDPRRTTLQAVVGYLEVVWIVLGAYVVTDLVGRSVEWLGSRAVTHWVTDFWADVRIELPVIGGIGDWLIGAIEPVGAALGIALIVPIAWLAIGTIIYGIEATDVIADDEVARVGGRAPLLNRVTRRFGDTTITRAWHALAEPNGRFGALIGGMAMIVRAGWVTVLVFCLGYVLITQIPYLVWGVARLIAGNITALGWFALWDPLDVIAEILVLMVSAALLAAAADALLQRYGANPSLRLPLPRRSATPAALAGSHPGTHPGAAPDPGDRPPSDIEAPPARPVPAGTHQVGHWVTGSLK